MKKIYLVLIAMALASVTGLGSASYAAEYAKTSHKKAAVAKVDELKPALRDLWLGHIFWVRNVALATRYGNDEGAKVAEGKAVQNAKDIAASITPYYGKEASDKLFTLLAGHYGAVKEYMTAAYAGDKAGEEKASAGMLRNADEIAAFLSGANPYLPKETLVSLLTAHGGHHMAQIKAIANKDYAAEAPVWDAMKNHMYVIADALAGGLAKQFPAKAK
jgi:hypothetical protein